MGIQQRQRNTILNITFICAKFIIRIFLDRNELDISIPIEGSEMSKFENQNKWTWEPEYLDHNSNRNVLWLLTDLLENGNSFIDMEKLMENLLWKRQSNWLIQFILNSRKTMLFIITDYFLVTKASGHTSTHFPRNRWKAKQWRKSTAMGAVK